MVRGHWGRGENSHKWAIVSDKVQYESASFVLYENSSGLPARL